ncbi:MAG: 50S ribosomal protein L25 [Candidatus Caenarcaniphilales bacterium]|nr:50S ribosomal protein L25 [Candidatus Caenarcaniphilales bacterium]
MSKSLSLKKRNESQNPRQIRRDGNIPVTVYGKRLEKSLSLQIEKTDFQKLHLSQEVQTIDGDVEGTEKQLLIIKSIEKNPVTEEVLNIQFQSVSPDDMVKVTIPIRYVGISPLVQAGGNLLVSRKKVNLICPAKLIPSFVEYNIANLKDSKSFACYSDLTFEEGVILKSDAQQIIVKVSAASQSASSSDSAESKAA